MFNFTPEEILEIRKHVGSDKEFDKIVGRIDKDYVEQARAYCLAGNKLGSIVYHLEDVKLRVKLEAILDSTKISQFSYLLYKMDKGKFSKAHYREELVEAIREAKGVVQLIQFYKSLVAGDDINDLLAGAF